MTMTKPETEEFLKKPLPAVLSTVDRDGRPRSAPLWFHWEEGVAYMFTSRESLKWRNLLRSPFASLCVDQNEPPYKYVVVDGFVAEVDLPIYEFALTLSLRYYGEGVGRKFAERYRNDDGSTVVFKLTPGRIVTYDES